MIAWTEIDQRTKDLPDIAPLSDCQSFGINWLPYLGILTTSQPNPTSLDCNTDPPVTIQMATL